MTVVVAVRRGANFAMAADTRVCTGGQLVDRYDYKVRRHHIGWFGAAGSLKELQLANLAVAECEHLFDVPEAIASVFKSHGWSRSNDTSVPFNEDFAGLILTLDGQIWGLDGKLAFRQSKGPMAIGTGAEVALGAIHARPDLDAADAARLGATIAAKLIHTCGTPIKVYGG